MSLHDDIRKLYELVYKGDKQGDFNESVICILLNMEERISALESNIGETK